jgi:hypothetical protein
MERGMVVRYTTNNIAGKGIGEKGGTKGIKEWRNGVKEF